MFVPWSVAVKKKSYGMEPSAEIAERVRVLVAEVGVTRAARLLGVSPESAARIALRARVTRGVLSIATTALEGAEVKRLNADGAQ